MFENNPIFEKSCLIRPIRGFNPEMLLEVDTQSFRRYLTPDAKLLWFTQYCLENGMNGKIDTQFVSSENLGNIPCSTVEGGIATLFKEYWGCTVYINGEAISTAAASGTFVANDPQERDFASNQLRKSAIGAALSQAGFGVISGFNMTANDITALCAQAAQQPGVTAPGQMPQQANGPAPAPQAPVMPQPAAPQAPAQTSFFGNGMAAPNPFGSFGVAPGATTAPAPVQPAVTAPVQPAPMVQADPVAEAKQLIWNGSGRFKGQTLGQILGETGGVKNLQYIAVDYKPRHPDGQKLQEGAKLILSSLQTGH